MEHGASGRIAEKSKVGKSKVEGGMVGYPARWTGLRGCCTVGALEGGWQHQSPGTILRSSDPDFRP